jgi:signal transduction histidine kinase/ActR/RegA family two-component response regulator
VCQNIAVFPLARLMTRRSLRGEAHAVPAFLSGGGEAGALVRAFDWSRTPVGPVERWPSALKTTVGTLLHSRHPMFLWWGPDLIQFYNDAYSPSFGRGRHPAAMGQRGEDCWQDIWPIIWPQIEAVMRDGDPSWNEDHLVPIIRNGRLEEVYWTYGYSPVFDDDGSIGGTLVVCTETTSQVLARRRLLSLRTLAELTALATDADAALDLAADALGAAIGDVACALIYRTRSDTDDPNGPRNAPAMVRAVGVQPATAAALDAHFRDDLPRIAAGADPWPLPASIAVTCAPWQEEVASVYVVPIGNGEELSGYLLVGLSPRLPFDAPYRDYLRQLGERMAQSRQRIEAFHVRALVEHERNSLLQQAPVATALLTGPRHVFQLANPLFLEMVGRDNLNGRAYREAFPELADTPIYDILDDVYRTGTPYVTNEMHLPLESDSSGTREARYFKFNLEPLRDVAGDVYGMMAIAVDITTQVLARKKLEQTQVEREELLTQLEAASRAKDEFLAMLGHELRNPLAPILTAVQLMRMRDVQEVAMECEIIERQVQHVVGLVDDLLDVSRITRGLLELRRERVQLIEIVGKAIEQACPLIEERQHRLHVDVPSDIAVDGDMNRLAQVVSNLLTNAAKYTEPGGDITLRAACEDGEAVLSVRDNGIGIEPQMLPHVFATFVQARQRNNRPRGGLGLGLAIVKSLVDAHGGSVALHSEGLGCGTECIIRLPLAGHEPPAHSQSRTAATSPATSTTGCSVLVVDDNGDAADLLGESLRALGHTVAVAHDAPQALRLATDHAPDIALLDLGLPVIDGYELAGRLRRLHGWGGVQFVALTGYGQRHDQDRTAAAGFAAHLTKPADVHEIDAVLRQLAGIAPR